MRALHGAVGVLSARHNCNVILEFETGCDTRGHLHTMDVFSLPPSLFGKKVRGIPPFVHFLQFNFTTSTRRRKVEGPESSASVCTEIGQGI